ncbi:MAG: hypothetical protein IKR91_04810 [Alloprevotella sp.]|nr:hypothetical protein [Alloprevotella sp.]
MSHRLRRHISAWVLLAVFLPTLVLTSLHHHQEPDGYSCAECVRHMPHSGHIAQHTFAFDNCLLCQFSSLPCLVWSQAPTILYITFFVVLFPFLQRVPLSRLADSNALRAPPVVCRA